MNSRYQIRILRYYLENTSNIFSCIFLGGINAQFCFMNIAIYSKKKTK